VSFCTTVHSTSLSCLVYCSQLPGLSFMYDTYPSNCHFWRVVTSRKNSYKQDSHHLFSVTGIFLSELEWCRILQFNAQCRIYPSLLSLDLDYSHVPKLFSIKPMSNKRKIIALFSCCKCVFVSPGLITSSVAHYLNQIRVWEEIYQDSLTGVFAFYTFCL